ncbi:MAG: 4-hydroxybenzoyl-CoA thioesterase [Gammaproteobacteria bacterium]|nr:4-hydroxybenzoyl-CoA thioesterase [Gammaproteobacteria bacterium]
MAGELIYRTGLAPEWIDYNGHLRDAYYGLIVSFASDALMDRLGMDAPYRERTRNTLYTVEMHIHYLREVKKSDTVLVSVRMLGADHKRIHAAFDLAREGDTAAAASAELMLLHVHQGETVSTQPFPPQINAAIGALLEATAGVPAAGPGSRRIELRRK